VHHLLNLVQALLFLVKVNLHKKKVVNQMTVVVDEGDQ